jgi:hypothetical protein
MGFVEFVKFVAKSFKAAKRRCYSRDFAFEDLARPRVGRAVFVPAAFLVRFGLGLRAVSSGMASSITAGSGGADTSSDSGSGSGC